MKCLAFLRGCSRTEYAVQNIIGIGIGRLRLNGIQQVRMAPAVMMAAVVMMACETGLL